MNATKIYLASELKNLNSNDIMDKKYKEILNTFTSEEWEEVIRTFPEAIKFADKNHKDYTKLAKISIKLDPYPGWIVPDTLKTYLNTQQQNYNIDLENKDRLSSVVYREELISLYRPLSKLTIIEAYRIVNKYYDNEYELVFFTSCNSMKELLEKPVWSILPGEKQYLSKITMSELKAHILSHIHKSANSLRKYTVFVNNS